MRIQNGLLVSLGHGKFVRSDEIVAIEPIVEGRGAGRRSLVWVRGVPEALVASRSETAIVADLLPRSESSAIRQQRTVLNRFVRSLDAVPPVLRRVLREESGVDLDDLVEEANRILAA